MAFGGVSRGTRVMIGTVVVAAVLLLIILSIVQEKQQAIVEAQRPPETMEVVVALSDINPGSTITSDMLTTLKLPVDQVPSSVIPKAEDIVGRVAQLRILHSDFFWSDRLADPKAGVGLPAIIPRGYRAMQVPVKEASAVSGFLNPGNMVDIIAACTEGLDEPVAKTVLRGVTVLAVNDRITELIFEDNGGSTKRKKVKPSITLALTPTDAERVKYALSECELSLTLRNDTDHSDRRTSRKITIEKVPTSIVSPAAQPQPYVAPVGSSQPKTLGSQL